MLLTVDMGNTNIKLGVFKGDDLISTGVTSTERGKTSELYAIEIKQILTHKGIDCAAFTGAIISSVVPEITQRIKSAVEDVTGVKPIVVGPGVKTGINIKIDDPRTLGSDLLVGALAASERYPSPCYVIDLGTATKISVVSNKIYRGCTIAPGVRISLSALSGSASQLFSIPLEAPPRAIGTNTVDSMQSGVIFGAAAMLDGMIERFNEETGVDAFVVATGGNAGMIIPHCKKKITLDKNLILYGLKSIYDKNM